MLARDHRPTSFLLIRLTDGRVRAVATPEGIHQARQAANRIRNEYGPASVALSITVDDQHGGTFLAVEDVGHGDPAIITRLRRDCSIPNEFDSCAAVGFPLVVEA